MQPNPVDNEIQEAVGRVIDKVLHGEMYGPAAWDVAAGLELSPEATRILVKRGLMEIARRWMPAARKKARAAQPVAS